MASRGVLGSLPCLGVTAERFIFKDRMKPAVVFGDIEGADTSVPIKQLSQSHLKIVTLIYLVAPLAPAF